MSVWAGGSGGPERGVGATAWFSFLAQNRTQAWWQVTALPEPSVGPIFTFLLYASINAFGIGQSPVF